MGVNHVEYQVISELLMIWPWAGLGNFRREPRLSLLGVKTKFTRPSQSYSSWREPECSDPGEVTSFLDPGGQFYRESHPAISPDI